jgi:PAS domain S-box-containing protein
MLGKISAERVLAGLHGHAVLMLNGCGRILCANASASSLFALTSETFQGELWQPNQELFLSSFFSLEGKENQSSEQKLASELQAAAIYGRHNAGFWCTTNSGKKLWLEFELSCETATADNTSGAFVVLVRDSTKSKKREEVLKIQLELSELLSLAGGLDDCANAVLHLIAEASGWNYAAMWAQGEQRRESKSEREEERLYNISVWARDPENLADFIFATRASQIRPGQSHIGAAWSNATLIWSANPDELIESRRAAARMVDIKSFLAIPIVLGGEVLAVVEMASTEALEPDQGQLTVFAAVAHQLAQFISRKKLEQEIAEQQNMTAQIVQSANDIFIAMDSDGIIAEWNKQAEYTLGWSREEAVGQPMAELIIPDRYREQHHVGMAHTIETGRGPMLSNVTKVQALCKDGSEVPVSMAVFSISVGARKIFCAFLQDLEEKMLTNAALEHSEEMFRLLVESVQDYSIVLLDAQGRFASWNAGAERLRGYSTEDVLGKYYGLSFSPTEAEMGLPEKLLERARETGRAEDIGWRLRKDGTPYLVESTITALRSSSGSLKGFAKISRDITERKRAEEELRVARDRALEASSAKSVFLANMSHEIRTPLNGILGISEMLLKTPLTERQFSFAQTINEAGKSLLSVINDILDFSRIEAGKFVIDIHEFDPRAMLHSVLQLMGNQAMQKNLVLSYSLDPNIPERLMGDSMRLRQVLLNYVANAVKFSESGEIRITGDLVGWQEDRALLRFAVADEGIGISPAKEASLFEPFVQIDASSTRRHGGSGLGLSICKRLAELMGAEVGVDSKEGHGSSFWITLALDLAMPCKEADAPPLAGAKLSAEASTDSCDRALSSISSSSAPSSTSSSSVSSQFASSSSEAAAEANISGRRILLISDDDLTKNLVSSYLTSRGAQVTAVSGPAGGLDALRIATITDTPYHCCLVDLSLPLNAAIELGKLISADSTIVAPALIMVAAAEERAVSQEALASGFSGCISKPIKHRQLLYCLSRMLAKPEEQPRGRRHENGEITTLTLRAIKPHLALVVESSAVTQQVVVLTLQDLGFEAIATASAEEAADLLKKWYFSIVIYDCHLEHGEPFALVKMIRSREADLLSRLPIIGMTDDPNLQVDGRSAGVDNFINLPVDPEHLTKLVLQYRPAAEV